MTQAFFNFIRGAGSAINLAPSRYDSRVGDGIDLSRSDSDALGRDWQRVAQDFRAAFDETTKEPLAHDQSRKQK